MKLEDIKKMSNEEFIKLINDLIDKKYYYVTITGKNKEVSKEKREKLIKRNELLYNISIGVSCFLVSNICLYYISDYVNYLSDAKEKLVIGSISLGLLFVGYFGAKRVNSNINYDITNIINENIIELKRLLENLTEEELKILVENISFYQEYKVSDELIKKSNVLLAANRLIELDATKILEEFELSNEETTLSSYTDDAKVIGNAKTMNNN